ncbi:hypothetical protein ACFVXQ_30915 [Kitasatospora sp. NPDC058263]
MSELPGFAALLARLLDHRGPEPAESARRAGVTDAELAAVLDGAAPDPALLRRLAPALGLDTAFEIEIGTQPRQSYHAPAAGKCPS